MILLIDFCHVQACAGDLGVGMHSWAQILLPSVSGNSSCNPQLRDLVLQLVERLASLLFEMKVCFAPFRVLLD